MLRGEMCGRQPGRLATQLAGQIEREHAEELGVRQFKRPVHAYRKCSLRRRTLASASFTVREDSDSEASSKSDKHARNWITGLGYRRARPAGSRIELRAPLN